MSVSNLSSHFYVSTIFSVPLPLCERVVLELLKFKNRSSNGSTVRECSFDRFTQSQEKPREWVLRNSSDYQESGVQALEVLGWNPNGPIDAPLMRFKNLEFQLNFTQRRWSAGREPNELIGMPAVIIWRTEIMQKVITGEANSFLLKSLEISLLKLLSCRLYPIQSMEVWATQKSASLSEENEGKPPCLSHSEDTFCRCNKKRDSKINFKK